MPVYTSTRLTTDHGSRFGVKPTRVVLHHAATTSLTTLLVLMMPGGRTVSAHAAISGAQIVNVVPESRRSFSLGAAVFERAVLSAECVNSTLAPDWRLSDQTHESVARWVADVCERHDILPHRDGPPTTWTVIGHREVFSIHRQGYATACPGGMKLDSIVERAQQIMAQPAEEEDQPMRNYVNTATYSKGTKPAAIKGTQAMTVFADGTYLEYLRDPANSLEPAKIFTAAVGAGHQEMTGEMYDGLKQLLRKREPVSESTDVLTAIASVKKAVERPRTLT